MGFHSAIDVHGMLDNGRLQSKGEIEELELLNGNIWEKGVVAEQLAGGLEVSLLAGYGTIVSSPVFSNVYFVVGKFTRLITRKCELCTY